MAKLKETAIQIFDNQIHDKANRTKEKRNEYNQIAEQLKELDIKIDYHKRNGDYGMVTKLKREQEELENQMLEVDEVLNSHKFKITDDEFQSFDNAYQEEVKLLSDEHEQLHKEMEDKLKDVAKTYRKLVNVKNEAGRRISRKQFVDKEKVSPGDNTNLYKGQIRANEVDLGDQSTERDYSWRLDDLLHNETLEAFQQYYYNKKVW